MLKVFRTDLFKEPILKIFRTDFFNEPMLKIFRTGFFKKPMLKDKSLAPTIKKKLMLKVLLSRHYRL
jgi:hypothetical protein